MQTLDQADALSLHHKNTCVTKHPMDTTIRNIDEKMYRALKAKAALAGKTVGEMVNEAIQVYLARPDAHAKRGSLKDLKPEEYPSGNERLSEEVDAIVYSS
jgi:plasmid stability protein